MNGRRRFAVLSVLLGTLLLSFLLASAASASPVSQKKARLQQIQGKLQAVYHQVDVAVEKYNQATTQLSGVQQQIKQNAHLLKVAEYNLQVADEQLQSRALDIYKTRDVGIVDVLFSSSSFDDLVTQLNMMQRLGNSDVDTVKSIAAYQQDIKNRRVKLEADKKSAAKLVADRTSQKDQVLGLQHKLESMTAGIKSQIKQLEAQQAAAAQAAAQAAAAASTSSASSSGSSGGASVPDPGGSGQSAVVAIAQRYLGVPYVYGGASPSGFDCSGLVMYCYAQIGIGLSHGATDQQRASTPVPLSALQPGDLVFFGGPSYSYHVGIYVGGGSMINAPHTGAVVSYGSIGGAWIGGRF
ncbi:MAG TPA: NlpC/P60 family protein [Thermoleophilia bacterium]|nr:NlpC/P60 family protein [Thermoleophilia bacterium]